ncbi:MAG: four-carbon acid sugar kinase family protein [Armatimonadetes bacterium]|nr:four-carbon acid sugar kinase family protein [Armatimonadota bacterium]
MQPFGILADDLTGALDSALPFARRGYRTAMLLDAEASVDCDVLALSTESRSDPPALASAKTAEGLRRLTSYGAARLYKKIDSTLRGPVAAEIGAAVEFSQSKAALVCPSFPAQGRFVLEGVLYVYGVPLAQSPFAPPGSSDSYIPKLLHEASGLPVFHIPLAVIERGVRAVRESAQEAARQGYRLLCADAREEIHLQGLAMALMEMPDILPCGSAGLSQAIADILPTSSSGVQPPAADRPALVVAGSQHPATKIQVFRLVEAGIPSVRWPVGAEEEGWHPASGGQDMVIELALAEAERERFRDSAFRSELLRRMAAAVSALMPEMGGLIISGGETACAVLKALSARAVLIADAVFPGVPASRIAGGEADGMALITKAGGFGEPDALLQAIRYLKPK